MTIRIVRFISVLAFVLMTSTAFAQATRTWVSGVGDDANPCSRTAPCKTFAGAISKTAPGGEIDALDPAGFGEVTITKALTIDGGGGQVASVLVSGTNGIIVNAGVNDIVILRNLQLNGISSGLSGVRFLSGKQLVVDHVQIFGFMQNGVDVALSGPGDVVMRDTVITNVGQTGVNLNTTSGNVHASLNNVSIRIMANGVVTNVAGATADISNSTIIGAINDGVHAVFGAISIAGSTFARNGIGVVAGLSGKIFLNDSTFYSNTTAAGCGGQIVSAGNNHMDQLGSGCAPTGTMMTL